MQYTPASKKFLFYKILTIKRPSLQARGNQPMR
ncbi:hypothetical protein RB2083_1070 [Rhodobacteraceae bacterium HTCC2083]|nr:hypothetical protein RB2083_1070 [Rhodobacteraceae bacterium HTCC2083]